MSIFQLEHVVIVTVNYARLQIVRVYVYPFSFGFILSLRKLTEKAEACPTSVETLENGIEAPTLLVRSYHLTHTHYTFSHTFVVF